MSQGIHIGLVLRKLCHLKYSSWFHEHLFNESSNYFNDFLFSIFFFLEVEPSIVIKICKNMQYYSVVSIKRKGCNKRTGEAKFFLVHEKKNKVVQKFFLVHEKKYRVEKNFKIV